MYKQEIAMILAAVMITAIIKVFTPFTLVFLVVIFLTLVYCFIMGRTMHNSHRTRCEELNKMYGSQSSYTHKKG